MPSHLGALAIACAQFIYAHWGVIATVAILVLSVLNKLLPGHPRYSGFVRLAISALAASPMAGARSAVFLLVATKIGDGNAAAFFHWLSTWLDIPILSKSVSAPGGQPRFSGNVTGGSLVIVFCLLATGARAQTPPATNAPVIGGCFANGKWCVGPTVSLTVPAINLTTKHVEAGFNPGVGLGVTYMKGTWSSVGLGVYFNLIPGSQGIPDNAGGAVIASFLNGWGRVGVSKGFLGDTSTRLVFGTGIDL